MQYTTKDIIERNEKMLEIKNLKKELVDLQSKQMESSDKNKFDAQIQEVLKKLWELNK